jgi:tetratricopeptide (TPR) repeat protein
MGAKQNAAIALVFAAVPLLLGRSALAEDPRVQDALTQGGYYKDRGANSEANKYYVEAVRLAPKDYLTHRALADNLATQKKYPQALSEINLAIGINPKDFKLYVDRGLIYMGLDKSAAAEADFKKAVSSPMCGHAVYKYLADLYKVQGRLDDAIAVCDLHIKREQTEETYRDKGALLTVKKDYAGARQALTKAISSAPFNYRNYELRADANLAAGAAKEAVADYTKALSLEPYFACEIYRNRARAYGELGKKDLEQKDIKSSLAKD